MGGGRSGPGQHRPAPLVRSSSGEVWRLQPEPPLRRVSAQGVEELGQELARLGHVPQRVDEALRVEVGHVGDLGQGGLLVVAMAPSVLARSMTHCMLENSCVLKSCTFAAAARHSESKTSGRTLLIVAVAPSVLATLCAF